MLRQSCCALLLFTVLVGCQNSPAPEFVVVRASELIDGTGGNPRQNVRILIRHGIIEAVEDDNDLVPTLKGAAVVDARGLTVTPGFVATLSECDLEGLRDGTALHRSMSLGITTAEVVSGDPGRAGALRKYTGVARHRGPRVVVAATIAPGKSGVQTLRALVRQAADRGAEIVHVPLVGATETAREALCALVDEAHAQDMRTMVEVDSPARFEAARACIAETLVWRGNLPPAIEPEPLRELPEVVVNAAETTPAAALAWEKAGALMAMSYGEPMCALNGVALGQVMERLVKGGMTRERVVAAFTAGAARTLGLGDALGKIVPGYRADLLVTEGRGLGSVRHVLIDGIEQSLEDPSLFQRWVAWWELR
ncbi:MAG: amidohydrolase family protein [Myxococcota bacterium]|nr:amidohydrolase family protein [Myxococcota bacterium]